MPALLLALLLAQATARRSPPGPPPGRTPLSAEDRELVKQLALLERVELLRNLELFEGAKDDAPPDSRPRQP